MIDYSLPKAIDFAVQFKYFESYFWLVGGLGGTWAELRSPHTEKFAFNQNC